MIDSPYFKLLVLFGTKFPEGNKKFPQNSPGFWSAPASISFRLFTPLSDDVLLSNSKRFKAHSPVFYLGPNPQFEYYPQFSPPKPIQRMSLKNIENSLSFDLSCIVMNVNFS